MPLLVDAVIAVHDPTRPVARAVGSLTRSGLALGSELRVTVVCHNLPVAAIAPQLEGFGADGVRCIALADGIRSPAGPFNAGIEASSARFVSIMGSDDYLEDGALSAWLDRAAGAETEAVIAPQVHASGAAVRTPPVRRLHRGELDPVADRLSYRTAPLGLIANSAIDRLSLRFTPGLASGEDQAFSTRLWFEGTGLRYAAGAPRYVVGADAEQRVSMTPQPLAEQFAFVGPLVESDWFRSLPSAARRAVAVKVTRVHLFAAVLVRLESALLDETDREVAAQVVNELREGAGGFERSLSLADRAALDLIADAASDPGELTRRLRARRRFGRPETLLTRDPRGFLAADGPLRFMSASALM